MVKKFSGKVGSQSFLIVTETNLLSQVESAVSLHFTSLSSFRVKVMFQKQTPKKFLHSVESSLCRVCANVCDKCHSNNLFSERNCVLLAVAETLHGKPLPQGDFPHLVCRPCSRRLNNTKLLQDQIHKSQALFESNLGERFKRCIEISPSAPKTIKSLKISTSTEAKMTKSRRGLSFSAINSLENVVSIKLILKLKCL